MPVVFIVVRRASPESVDENGDENGKRVGELFALFLSVLVHLLVHTYLSPLLYLQDLGVSLPGKSRQSLRLACNRT